MAGNTMAATRMATTFPCNNCAGQGKNKIAVGWCDKCMKFLCTPCKKRHQKLKFSSNHSFMPVEDYHIFSLRKERPIMFCRTHPSKVISMYCRFHNHTICDLCKKDITHFNCKTLDINSDGTGARNSFAINDLNQRLRESSLTFGKILKNRNRNLKALDRQKETIVNQVQSFRENMRKAIEILIKKLLEDVDIDMTDYKTRLQTQIDDLKEKRKAIASHLEMIEELQLVGSNAETVNFIQDCAHIQTRHERYLLSLPESVKDLKLDLSIKESFQKLLNAEKLGGIRLTETEVEIDVPKNTDRTQIPYSAHQLGFDPHLCSPVHVDMDILTVRENEYNNYKNRTLSPITPKQTVKNRQENTVSFERKALVPTFYLSSDFVVPTEEKNDVMITGVLILDDGNLLLADGKNKRLLNCTEEGSVLDVYPLKDEPFDFTLVDSNRVFVTLPFKKYFQVVYPKEKEKRKIVELTYGCFGITKMNKLLVVACKTEGLLVIDHRGQILNTIITPVSYRNYVHSAGNKIYFTNDDDSSFICFDSSGDIIYKFKYNGSIFKGITSLPEGKVLVINYGSSPHVLEISTDGSKFLIDEPAFECLSLPYAINYNKTLRKLIISSECGKRIFVYRQ
ncbi:Hypothetical predicted protein [Mytilus galloprovincialis]|uniref:B box-type domain-containing protein n=2 Tax=Mytilus galloprovincialis TaxID=29158 RepID=A0A8B6EVQ4_MYTGA|nr:Hypothetical predicted protein [Mytilus galloprovincialis]